MNVASLDLCRELHELSAWGIGDPDVMWRWSRNGVGDFFQERALPVVYPGQIPAYDLGYLLRKLPPKVYDGILQLELVYVPGGLQWQARYYNYYPANRGQTFGAGIAETPEDAAALLCIRLIEEGALKI